MRYCTRKLFLSCLDTCTSRPRSGSIELLVPVGRMVFNSPQLIASIKDGSRKAKINGYQCSRLANRINIIDEVMKVKKSILEGENLAKLHEYLPTLLKRARSLVYECGGSEWVTQSLIRANNKEAFEEVHKELTQFLYKYTGVSSTAEGSTDFNTATLPPTTDLLNEDAERDLKEMLREIEKYQGALIEEGSNLEQPAVEHLRKIIKVVSDKCKDLASDHAGEQDSSASYLQIPLSEIVPKKLIGTGSYGNVYRAEWLGCNMCLKDFPWSGGYKEQWLNQAMPLLKLRHPNVLQLVGFSPSEGDSEKSKVLTEIMQGDIRSLIDRRMKEQDGKGTPFNWYMTLDIMAQVARGLSCMHYHKFMHGDRVLTTNIIIKEYDDYVDARIGDFGVPQDIPVEHVHVYEPRLGDLKGSETARWMAPEVCARTALYAPNSDIYSFGIFCYELLTSRIPFDQYPDMTAVHSQIVAGELRPELPENLDERVADIIKLCWHVDPSLRPDAQAIVVELENIQFSAAPTA